MGIMRIDVMGTDGHVANGEIQGGRESDEDEGILERGFISGSEVGPERKGKTGSMRIP
jgi:hypothetical protein